MGSNILVADIGRDLHQLLQRFEQEAQAVETIAVWALHVEQVQGPARTFASTLLRNTKGARAAAAAWRHALKNS